MIPFKPHELFEINKDCKISYHSNYIIVDNFYKNFEEVHDVLNNMPKEVWKLKENSRNFIDYYDTRPTITNHADIRFIYEEFFNKLLNAQCQILYREFEFNCFKWISPAENKNFQMMPHLDANKLVALVTIDKVNNGGTALYEYSKKEDFLFEYDESDNAICDVSHLKIHRIIPSKPNRLCIFSGDVFHGGYISDHEKYLHDWRMNQVFFLKKK